MNIIFMRHGEATDNVKELISDKEIYWSTLTENGVEVVKETVASLPQKIDKIYVSPLPRTIQTASLVRSRFSNVEFVIDNRIREIDYGKFSGQKNNEDLDKTREKQVAGDYFVRFGQYGENKLDIELRLTSFLRDLVDYNFKNNTIMIISHGSITSFMKRILNLKSPHIKTGKAEVFNDVDVSYIDEHYKKLMLVQKNEIKRRLDLIDVLNLNNILHKKLQYLCKHEINNIEFTSEVFDNFIKGLGSKSLTKISNSNFDSGVILICFYNNFENFAKLWMEHYINLGIKNFVLIDNNSTDKSTSIIKKYNNKVNLELWSVSDNYNCYKMCGWRQQILEHYGHSKTYLFVDSDELFVYRDYKTMPISEFIKSKRLKSSKSLMLDVYSEKGVEDENLANYKYVDKDTYKKTVCVFGERFYGGFRNRVFGIKPSLQKISLLYYTGNEILFNDHYCYPWSINSKSKLQSFLIHYKFLKGDVNKYKEFAIDGRHWNNSREYKVYVNKLNSCDNFYDEDNALDIDNVIELFS